MKYIIEMEGVTYLQEFDANTGAAIPCLSRFDAKQYSKTVADAIVMRYFHNTQRRWKILKAPPIGLLTADTQ